MQLSEIGEIARLYWMEIPNHFSFVKLDAFVVMPNHVHGIIIIDVQTPNLGVSEIIEPKNEQLTGNETPRLGVSTVKTGGKNDEWKPGTLGVIINQYKRTCTINARRIHADFGWQSRFHDHIIRDGQEFDRISEYIQNNPKNWGKDKFYDS